MMQFVRINTSFIPPADINKQAIELSTCIGNQAQSYFILDGVKCYSHITIYAPEYPEENLPQVIDSVRKLAGSIEPIKFRFKDIRTNQGYIEIHFENTDEIKGFHKNLVNALNPLRETRIRDTYNDFQMEFTPEQSENIKQYGHPGVLNLYDPHLTLIRLADKSKADSILADIKWDIPEFTVNKIGLYKMGEHGTCRDLVEEIALI